MTLSALNVAACRQQYPGLRRMHSGKPAIFLDGPGGSQAPQGVIDAVSDCLAHHNANEGGLFATSLEINELLDRSRQALADFVGAEDPQEIIFGQNMTSLTFHLSHALARTWRSGDEVIVTRLDHDANVSPWLLAAQSAGATVRYLDVSPADCTLQIEQLGQLLTKRTRLVAVGVASNAVGTVNPVREIIDAAHRMGALVFLDAVHSAPHLQTDIKAWGCDALACSAYKFFGPHLGVLWMRRSLLEELPVEKIRPAPDEGPGRWMTGTANFEGLAGTLAAVEYLALLGHDSNSGPFERRGALNRAFARIREHEQTLAARLMEGVSRLPGWRIWGIADTARLDQRVPTFGLTHERHSPGELAAALAEKGIFSWSGHFYAPGLIDALGLAPGGVLRLGALHYNTLEEIERVVETLGKIGT